MPDDAPTEKPSAAEDHDCASVCHGPLIPKTLMGAAAIRAGLKGASHGTGAAGAHMIALLGRARRVQIQLSDASPNYRSSPILRRAPRLRTDDRRLEALPRQSQIARALADGVVGFCNDLNNGSS